MPPVGVFRVVKAKLGVGRVGDPHAKPGDVMRLVGLQREAHRGSIQDDEAVATIGGVYGERTQTFDLQLRVQPVGKARQVLHEDALGLAVAALRTHTDEAAGCL